MITMHRSAAGIFLLGIGLDMVWGYRVDTIFFSFLAGCAVSEP